MQSAITQALLWLNLPPRRCRPTARQVQILVPPQTSTILSHRSRYLDPAKINVAVSQYERRPGGGLTVAPAPPPPTPLEERDFRWPVLGPYRWSPALGRVLDLAPGMIRRYPRFQDYDSLRLSGLEFARVEGSARDRILFGVGDRKTELSDENFSDLHKLVQEILYYRRADSPEPRHPFYRLQAERWLESLILENAPSLFSELMAETVYSQIPVYLGHEPGRVDILGVDTERRLVVMELKVTSDPNLPLQALDYWGRVIHHSQQGDFERRGYFSGIAVDRRPPRIYLVSPVFSFHDSTEKLVSYFSPGIEVCKVGINEDWRSGVKIMLRTRLRCGTVE